VTLDDDNTDVYINKGVSDGDTELSLQIESLLPQESVSFTIDVDDTLVNSEPGKIRASNSEIERTLVRLSIGKRDAITAKFNSDSKATVLLPQCLK
jgi:hypothetical protein